LAEPEAASPDADLFMPVQQPCTSALRPSQASSSYMSDVELHNTLAHVCHGMTATLPDVHDSMHEYALNAMHEFRDL